MSIIQSKRRIISLCIVAIFFTVSVAATTVTASALSYFCPFNETAFNAEEMVSVSVNSQTDEILSSWTDKYNTEWVTVGKIQKIVLPVDATVTLAARLKDTDSVYFDDEFITLSLLSSEDVESEIEIVMPYEGEFDMKSIDLKKGTYYLSINESIPFDAVIQEIYDGLSTTWNAEVFVGYKAIPLPTPPVEDKTTLPPSAETNTKPSVTVEDKVTPPGKTKIKSVKSKKQKNATIKWNRVSGSNGYQVVMAQNKKFTKKKKTINIAKQSTNITIKKLPRRKTYYVKVRAYKKVNGKKYYGSFSSVKKVKIK